MVLPEPSEKLAELEARCRDLGVPLTLQRRAVLEVLVAREDHPTADQVHAGVAEDYPGVSRATVYRGLETLVAMGIANRVSHPGAVCRYDARTCRHHHLVCDGCGAVIDYDEPSFDSLRYPKTAGSGFQVSDYSILFRGRCAACAASAEEGKEDP